MKAGKQMTWAKVFIASPVRIWQFPTMNTDHEFIGGLSDEFDLLQVRPSRMPALNFNFILYA